MKEKKGDGAKKEINRATSRGRRDKEKDIFIIDTS